MALSRIIHDTPILNAYFCYRTFVSRCSSKLPSMAAQTITDFYDLNDSSGKVTLEVNIGFGQPAASRVFVDFEPVGGQKLNDFSVELGSNQSLKDKKLIINTTVWDLQDATDQTSITIKLNGGKQPYERTAMCSVSEQGGVAIYITTIYF